MLVGEPTKPKYGTLVAPGLNAIIHQHFFNFRMDMEVDGPQNSVVEVHVEAEPEGPTNPYGNAFFARETLLTTEQEAQQVIDPLAGRYWKVIDSHSRNRMGEPVGYKLMPGENTVAFAQPSAFFLKRAGFTTKNLWVTPITRRSTSPLGSIPTNTLVVWALPHGVGPIGVSRTRTWFSGIRWGSLTSRGWRTDR